MPAALPPRAARMPLIDALKGVACLSIVWHHLAFYGPMSDAAHPLAPGLIDWLYANARIAVQCFLVISGFLAAGALAPDRVARVEHPGALILKRYLRLAIPCVAALTLAIACSAVARQLMTHDSISAPPGTAQLLAHVLLLQHLLGFEALSAGIWYVAIDFQLHAVAVLLLCAAAAVARRMDPASARLVAPALVTALTAASLFAFNLDDRLSDTGLYFAGAYGLGMLAFWASRAQRPGVWILGVALLGALALAFEFRTRIAVALATALLLAWGQAPGRAGGWPLPGWLAWTGLRSYSIFLVHFPVSLVVSGVFTRLWPADPIAAAAGMATSFTISLAIAAVFHRFVESRPATPLNAVRSHATFLIVGTAAALAGV